MLGSSERPLRVAIIGSGPSGFYAAEELLSGKISAKVDMFDRLPSPFGLVRYGVAPDHPKIKNVIKIFEKTAANPNFTFLGNVMVGRDIGLAELKQHYDAIILTCGAQTDSKLNVPGENLSGSHTATEFVAWYNGHPDYRDRRFDLSQEVAVVIGQGNVSMDVSRILCKSPDELKGTDIAAHALEALSKSRIREVHVIGRRGPAQAAFTPPEIKEMGELADCDVIIDPAEIKLNPESEAEINDPNFAPKRKNYDILSEYAQRKPAGKRKKLYVHFLKSPKELKGGTRVEKIVLAKNKLTGPTGNQKAENTGEFVELNCGLVFRSVGYRGVPIVGVPFDEKRGVFPHQAGRIMDNGKVVAGLYASGWIKRGPSGVIGTNKPDSVETVQSLIEDLPKLVPCALPDTQKILALLKGKGIKVVTFDDWKRIDAAEVANGQKCGKPREKFVRVEDMLSVLG